MAQKKPEEYFASSLVINNLQKADVKIGVSKGPCVVVQGEMQKVDVFNKPEALYITGQHRKAKATQLRIKVPEGTPIKIANTVRIAGKMHIGNTKGPLEAHLECGELRVGEVDSFWLTACNGSSIEVRSVARGNVEAWAAGQAKIVIGSGKIQFLRFIAQDSSTVGFKGSANQAFLSADDIGSTIRVKSVTDLHLLKDKGTIKTNY